MEQYRRLFLDLVKFATKKDPCRDTLLELLKITWPELTESEFMKVDKRKRALDRLNDSLEGEQELLSSIKSFCEKACEDMRRSKKQRTSAVVSPTSLSHKFPMKFLVTDTWAHVVSQTIKPKEDTCEEKHVAALAAAHCINARGAIAHQRKTELFFSIQDLLEEDETKETTVKSIFDRKGGGTKKLKSIEAIKQELTTNGPVVSTSFLLDEAFAAQKANKNGFSSEKIGKKHEVVIMGWKLTELGEVWVIKPPLGASGELTVAFGQFSIDRECLAPKSSFKMEAWQEGPYWDINLSAVKDEWKTWVHLHSFGPESSTEYIISLLKCLDGADIFSAARDKTRIVVRDMNELADSRACTLNKMLWNKDENRWEIRVIFTD